MNSKKFFILATVFIIITYCICEYNNHKHNAAISEINTLESRLSEEEYKYLALSEELQSANDTLNDIKSSEYKLVYIGEHKISHYCVEQYDHICGNGDGFTATGTKIKPGRTIAVDSSYIPYGSTVYIEGYGYRIAEDCGGAIKGKHIDMAVDTHDEAMDKGIKSKGVWVLVKTY